MLPDDVKNTIQQAYSAILKNRSLKPRQGQRQMIAEIARCLGEIEALQPASSDRGADKESEQQTGKGSGESIDQGTIAEIGAGKAENGKGQKEEDDRAPGPICVVEAGTGTGKTLAYLLATIPVAKHLGHRVVLATATVALQEQVIHKDLPDILRHSDLDFTYTLAKGRGRYLCLSKLDLLLQGSASQSAMADLYGEILDHPQGHDIALYESMFSELNAGRWQGDRDEWRDVLTEEEWRPVTVDNGQCVGQRCSNFASCCFYQAREEVQKADCVVANHDLVLADLALGGGVILPHPSESIYIFDEAHHLPLKSNSHFACFTRLRGSMLWLEQCGKSLSRLLSDPLLGESSARCLKHSRHREAVTLLAAATEKLEMAWPQFQKIISSLAPEPNRGRAGGDREALRHAFELGQVPSQIQALATELDALFGRLTALFDDVGDALKEDIETGQSLQIRQRAEYWFPVIGASVNRAESSRKLWHHFALNDPPGEAPWARWLTLDERGSEVDIMLSGSPVLAARNLEEKLWRECGGAVLTSATLSALGNFDVLNMRAGLPERSCYVRIASPFDYRQAGTFVVPKLNCEPGNSEAHTAAIISLLPKLLSRDEASLMLFSSRRQMRDVMEGMPAQWQEMILCQDDYQKAQLLETHRKRVDEGEGSVIFGLASFAEGVDLPGAYCVHVLIAKLPFAVPNDPIEATLAQWVERQGRNPFMTLSVPEAAFRLVQASGRLLRSEEDRGRITLFDERIVSKFYGRAIFDSLPPYSREIFPVLQE